MNQISANETIFQPEPKNKTEIALSRKEALVFLSAGTAVALFYAICFSGIDVLP